MKNLVIALLVALFLVTGCGRGGRENRVESITVSTDQVEIADVSLWAYAFARIEAENQTEIYSSGGTVENILVAQGDWVEAGELLVVLSTDNEVYSNIQSAAANLSAARAAQRVATDNLQRMQTLHEAGGLSDQQLLSATTSVESASASVRSAEATLNGIQSRSSNSTITAPFDGVVGRIWVSLGNTTGTGEPVLTLASTGSVSANILLPEDVLGKIHSGDPAELTVSSIPDCVFYGSVLTVSPFVDPLTGLVSAEVAVSDSSGALVPGMAIRVGVQLDIHKDVVVVPERYLISGTSGYQVAVEIDGIASLREATIGYRESGLAEITSGLNMGESLIVAGQQLVSDGSLVVIRNHEDSEAIL